ncbi:MAG: hypothetical protein IKO61_02420 [Lachnospiraceae bacterium]|nr:hypothetical protein [Lachnospiraceae bacterium]
MRKKLLLCALGMALFITGCGDKKDGTTGASSDTQAVSTTTAEETVKGATESWGVYEEILVPEGMKLTGGTTIDKEDKNAVWVQKSNDAMSYFLFEVSNEEQCKKDVEATKEYNKDSNPKDVTIKTGDYEWTGVAYKYDGYSGPMDISQMYAKVGNTVINVRIGGFAYDSDLSKSILASLKVKVIADEETTSEAATTTEAAGGVQIDESLENASDETTTEAATGEETTTEAGSNAGASDPTYGKSNADATGYVTLEVLQETYKWKQSAGAGLTYEEFRDHFGCDGAIWNEIWKEDHHGYKWRTEDGDFFHVSFTVKEDGSEIYSSCTYSDAVRE